MNLEQRLAAHLRAWLGSWPPREPVDVVGSAARTRPGWDGRVHPLVGVAMPGALVLSVPPDRAAAVGEVRVPPEDPEWAAAVAAAMGVPDGIVGRGVFRAVRSLPDLPPLGEWVHVDHPVVPAWLRPFGGEVLITRDADGRYAAGAGLKRHDPVGREISVGTEPGHRGKGLARRLVVTAARRVLREGRIATYLHDPANIASARVADEAGFPDLGWSVYGLWEPEPAA